jgi:AraC family transcriptional regulator of adaptative response / DNA-3-methyladenine glycosylase II
MLIEPDAAYRALRSRDARFDGVFFVGVRTTGIYCRPSCSARTPHRHNVGFYPSAAAAQRAGFRACKRCRPDSTPGSADWNTRADLAGRAVRLITDGVIDREGVPGLAQQLGYSERQVTRAVALEMGAPPLALARAQRAQTARILVENTAMTMADIAFASGFASIRQFNDTVRAVYATTPSQLRVRRTIRSGDAGILKLRLPYRPPMRLSSTLSFLADRAITGIEHYDGSTYSRTLRLPFGPGLVSVRPATGHVRAEIRLADHRDLAAAVARIRRLLDLDADPEAVDAVLSEQPGLANLVGQQPGLRSPTAVDGFEMALRATVGQQVSVTAARTILGRLVAQYGEVAMPGWDEWRLFPTPQVIAELDPTNLPMPTSRGRTIISLATAMASGALVLSAGSERATTRSSLLAVGGIGPWTADYLLMRAVGDPDVYLGTDLAIRRASQRFPGLAPVAAAPWRSYLTHHLWASQHTVMPAAGQENS